MEAEDLQHLKFMKLAIALSKKNIKKSLGGPFGAVIVRNGEVIARSVNKVTDTFDPTAHAEISAIRIASKKLRNFDLSDCVIYSSCEPCPMCLGAIYWSRISKIYYANTRYDAADLGFDDKFIYDELDLPAEKRKLAAVQLLRSQALEVFKEWQKSGLKILY